MSLFILTLGNKSSQSTGVGATPSGFKVVGMKLLAICLAI